MIVNAEPEPRRRLPLAHKAGHWVCHVLEGHAPLHCRAEGADAGKALEHR